MARRRKAQAPAEQEAPETSEAPAEPDDGDLVFEGHGDPDAKHEGDPDAQHTRG